MKILPLTSETIDLEIDMCQHCHLSGYIVDGVDADEGRKLKKAVFEDIFRVTGTAGFIAVEDGAPVSLLELMPRVFARRDGYITGSTGAREVGAFPRDVDFHPSWVYLDAGFQLAEDRGKAEVYSIRLSG